MSRREEIFKMSIALLGLPTVTGNKLAYRTRGFADRYDLTGITVREVVESLGQQYCLENLNASDQRFLEKLVELGLTRLDCVWLPQTTVTLAKMLEIPKQEWLDMDLRVLGTLSETALRKLEFSSRSGTVRALLALGPDGKEQEADESIGYDRWGRRNARLLSQGCVKSLSDTRTLLVKLGFGWEDSSFMRFGTKRELVEKLVEKYTVAPEKAKRIVDIAESENWIPPFFGY